MKIQTQHHPELAKLAERIDGISAAMLTTQRRAGGLDSRPMQPIEMDETGAFWFFTSRDSSVLEGTGEVHLNFVDPARSVFVTVMGDAAQVDDRERIHALWTPLARPWFPDGPDTPSLTLLKVQPASADVWDGTHNKMLRVLALAVSVAAGREIGLGGHEHLNPPLGGLAGAGLGPLPAGA